jgi:Flp pilus assembly protein TadG
MMRRFMRRRRADAERGAVLVITTMLFSAFLGIVAIVIDLGALRANARVDQSIADLAALSAGSGLADNNPTQACHDAIGYINTNAHLSSVIDASTFCSTMGGTSCTGGTGTATPSTTVGHFTVSIMYPVSATVIADPNITTGARLNDGLPCQRMRVSITSTQNTHFAAAIGRPSLSATRNATVRPWPVGIQKAPALWLLDPHGCTALDVTGGSHVSVGTVAVPGVLSIDSDGTSCTGSQKTIQAGGAGTVVNAIPLTGTDRGRIQLYALPPNATVCSGSACDPADVTGSRLAPQPQAVGVRATRSRVDDVFNCHSSYPAFHGIPVYSNCNPATTPSYVDNLKTAIGTSGAPSGYQRWTTTGHSCNAASGTTSVSGNWWIDCPNGNGLSIGNSTNVEFKNGNVVFDGNVTMTGGTLKFNTNNATTSLPASCVPPAVVTPCIGSASAAASFVYLRAGDINITGGVFTANHAFVYSKVGYVKINSSPPVWNAPTEGPFAYLALWCDMPSTSNNTNKFSIAGGAGVQLSGVFFTPEAAPLSLTGSGDWGQQNAQFISYHLSVSGGGNLNMSPDPAKGVKTPSLAGALIR